MKKPRYDVDYWSNGNKKYETWCLDIGLHNENGPAFINYWSSGNKKHEGWLINNLYSREDGPAFISYNEDGTISCKQYHINDKTYTEEEFRHYQLVKKLAGL